MSTGDTREEAKKFARHAVAQMLDCLDKDDYKGLFLHLSYLRLWAILMQREFGTRYHTIVRKDNSDGTQTS